MLDHINRSFQHLFWADDLLYNGLSKHQGLSEELLAEFAHILAAEEVWLARLCNRTPKCGVWPSFEEVKSKELLEETHQGYQEYLNSLDHISIEDAISYVNSAGNSFATKISDILIHVCLHSQYHRGKVNLMLKEMDLPPIPTDYIAFVRGVPAATTKR